MNAVARQKFNMRVINETDAKEVNDAKIGSMSFDLSNVYNFVDFLFFVVSQLKSSWKDTL